MTTNLIPRREDFFAPFESLFNQVFDGFTTDVNGLKGGKHGFPRIDVITDENHWIVEASVPGVAAENLSVEIIPEGNQRLLKISGKVESQYSTNAQWLKKELRRSVFERSFYLPANVKGEPNASLKDGMLRLVWETEARQQQQKQTVKIQYLGDK